MFRLEGAALKYGKPLFFQQVEYREVNRIPVNVCKSRKESMVTRFVHHALLDGGQHPCAVGTQTSRRKNFFFLDQPLATCSAPLFDIFELLKYTPVRKGTEINSNVPLQANHRKVLHGPHSNERPLKAWVNTTKFPWHNLFISQPPVNTVHIYTSNSVGIDRLDSMTYHQLVHTTLWQGIRVDEKHKLTRLNNPEGVTMGDLIDGVRCNARTTNNCIIAPFTLFLGEEGPSDEERIEFHKVVAKFFNRDYESWP